MAAIEIMEGYMNANKVYSVDIRTKMGGYMEFFTVESNIMFEENAKTICKSYAETSKGHDTFRSVCVRKEGNIIFEIAI